MAMDPTGTLEGDEFRLTAEHRMLLRMRDTLYEGSWEDFATDLRARAEDRPHVFETVPATPEAKAVIATHLTMVAEMQAWEARHRRALRADDPADTES